MGQKLVMLVMPFGQNRVVFRASKPQLPAPGTQDSSGRPFPWWSAELFSIWLASAAARDLHGSVTRRGFARFGAFPADLPLETSTR